MKRKKKVLKLKKNIIILIVSSLLLVILTRNSDSLLNYRINILLLFLYISSNFIVFIKQNEKK